MAAPKAPMNDNSDIIMRMSERINKLEMELVEIKGLLVEMDEETEPPKKVQSMI